MANSELLQERLVHLKSLISLMQKRTSLYALREVLFAYNRIVFLPFLLFQFIAAVSFESYHTGSFGCPGHVLVVQRTANRFLS